jgi:hypothetical protein
MIFSNSIDDLQITQITMREYSKEQMFSKQIPSFHALHNLSSFISRIIGSILKTVNALEEEFS